MERRVPGNRLIRPMLPAELDPVVDLVNTASATDIRYVLRSALTQGEDGQAIVAEHGRDIVGAATVTTDHVFPGTISATLAVRPGYRRQGTATALATALHGDLRAVAGVDTLTTSICDDQPAGRSFAERHGFALASHSIGYRFELPGEPAELVRQADQAAQRAGVRVRRAFADTEGEAILDCYTRCRAGLPLRYGPRPADPAARLRELPPDTVYLLAEPADDPAPRPSGITVLLPGADGAPWYTRFTGTDPGHRGRGVAAAVKTAALCLAWRAGAPAVVTHNREANSAIRSLNESLGMKPDVGYWAMTRPLPR